ncbi:35303_t:CDS:1, partial [Racocetra persica]
IFEGRRTSKISLIMSDGVRDRTKCDAIDHQKLKYVKEYPILGPIRIPFWN